MPAAIVVDNVSKKFLIGKARYSSLRDVVSGSVRRIFGGRSKSETERTREFWALKDVSFEVEKGATLGIIGPNGAGKSTMLKLISRVSAPTQGTITTHGRVSALIEVGAGFHPELTGRENVYLNGSILGMKKTEIDKKFDAIVDFSGIEEFIDTPVKYYSSGMFARLGFSVAAHVEPDILVVDEVLSVGDWAFQQKCLERMERIRQEGVTVVFVSHNLSAVARLCKHSILLDHGEVQFLGISTEASHKYYEMLGRSAQGRGEEGTRQVELLSWSLCDESGAAQRQFKPGDRIVARFEFRSRAELENLNIGIGMTNESEVWVYHTCTAYRGFNMGGIQPGQRIVFQAVIELNLVSGVYNISVGVTDKTQGLIHYRNQAIVALSIGNCNAYDTIAYCPTELSIDGKQC